MPMPCPQCGTTLPAALDLCPACLLSAALSVAGNSCPYRIVAPIAEGRGGTTYLAQPSTGGRAIVALKILTARNADDVLTRYGKWKPSLARIAHPHVSSILDAGVTDEGLVYIASRFVPGWPLHTIDEHQSVDAEARAEIARQIASAVAAIHDAGLAHLAIRPSKVRVSTADGVHATLLGLGVRLIVEGDEPSADADRRALADLHLRLGVRS